ncbi:MAG: signal peptidase II [Syntrophales bacterium]|nr:signal peptidase II [Syntrophales bacterium]
MNKRYAPLIRLILAVLILFSCIGCDQVTKSIATQTLQQSPPQSFLADTVRLEYVLNPGGFLSLGSNLPDDVRFWIFVGFNSCMMLALSAYLLLNPHMPFAAFVSVVFVLAGGVGNLIDRILNNGFVTDFINLGVGPLRTGVFNVADMAVTFGVIAAVFVSLRQKAAEPNDEP